MFNRFIESVNTLLDGYVEDGSTINIIEINLDDPEVGESAQTLEENKQRGAAEIMVAEMQAHIIAERTSYDAGISKSVDDVDEIIRGLSRCFP